MQVLAISCDTAPAQKKWADEMGYQFPVLSDFWPHGEVSKAYGVFNDKLGCAMRYTFLVGKDGRVLDVFDSGAIGTPRESARYAEGLPSSERLRARPPPRRSRSGSGRRRGRCVGRSGHRCLIGRARRRAANCRR